MLIPSQRHSEALKALIKDSSTKKIIIFVSLDCDAICCCNILTFLLRMEHVSFSIFPVSGYQNLKMQFLAVLESDADPGAFVFLNNGGSVDLVSFLIDGVEELNGITFYVLDSNRPFDLDNVSDENQTVLLFCDEMEMEIKYPIGAAEIDEMDESKAKKLESKIKQYYKGTHFGSSISHLLYEISVKISKANNNLLWFAILGVTDQLESERIGPEEYIRTVQKIQKEVLQINLPNIFRAEKEQGKLLSKVGHIEFSREPKLTLYRHWNIFEGLFFSRYIASQFLVWKDSGKKRIMDFIARLAIPLNECKRSFCFLSGDDSKLFEEKLSSLTKKFDLEDMYFGSFIRRYDPKTIISANEMVQSMKSLFVKKTNSAKTDEDLYSSFWEAYDSIKLKNLHLFFKGATSAQQIWRAVILQGNLVLEKRSYTAAGRFICVVIDDVADQLIVTDKSNLLGLALFLFSALGSISEKKNHFQSKGKKRGGKQRNGVVGRNNGAKRGLVGREKNTAGGKSRALVVCAFDKSKGVYVVVGLPSKTEGKFNRNGFGNAFREAAEKTKTRYRHEGFSSNFIEIQKEDKSKFLDYLHSGLVEFV